MSSFNSDSSWFAPLFLGALKPQEAQSRKELQLK